MSLVLSSVLTAYRTLLLASPASLVANLDQNETDQDTTGTVHRKFRMYVSGTPDLKKMFGGGVCEYDQEVILEVSWDPEQKETDVWNTASDDMTNVMAVMLKASNRPSGCQIIKAGRPNQITAPSSKQILAPMVFVVTYRETQDMT